MQYYTIVWNEENSRLLNCIVFLEWPWKSNLECDWLIMSCPTSPVASSGDSVASSAADAPPAESVATSRSRKATADDFVFGKIIGEGSFSTVGLRSQKCKTILN